MLLTFNFPLKFKAFLAPKKSVSKFAFSLGKVFHRGLTLAKCQAPTEVTCSPSPATAGQRREKI